jgi:hypothetical protein
MFNFDPLGKVLLELREDGDVAAIVGTDGSGLVRVRGGEPAPGDAAADATAGEPRYKHAFVVLTELGTPRHPRLPIQQPRLAGRCYGRTFQEAMELYVACSNAIHGAGPRVHTNGLGIYVSHDDTGGSASADPDTGQPYVDFVIAAVATTQEVVTA